MNLGIVLLGGKGTRIGKKLPKQFLLIDNKPMFVYSVEAFMNNEYINEIALVIPKEYSDYVKKMIKFYNLTKVKYLIEGGDTRHKSLWNALKHLSTVCNDNDIVVIHDAARPFIDRNLITANIKGVERFGAVSTAYRNVDSLTKLNADGSFHSVDRNNLIHIQTPQSFRFHDIYEAHAQFKEEATEDSQLLRRLGKRIHFIEGSPLLFKVTTLEDVIMADLLAKGIKQNG